MESGDKVALSLPAYEAVDRQTLHQTEGGGGGGKEVGGKEGLAMLWGRQVYSCYFVVFLKLYAGEDS